MRHFMGRSWIVGWSRFSSNSLVFGVLVLLTAILNVLVGYYCGLHSQEERLAHQKRKQQTMIRTYEKTIADKQALTEIQSKLIATLQETLRLGAMDLTLLKAGCVTVTRNGGSDVDS